MLKAEKEVLRQKMFQSHFFHKKSNIEWSRIEPGHPRYEAGLRHEREKRNKRQERETG
jgi:ribosomal protein L35